MAYVYDDGIATPGYASLIEVSGTSPLIRLNSSLLTGTEPVGGTFKLDSNPLLDGRPVSLTATAYATDHGGTLGPALYPPWTFTLPGWLWVPSGPDDVEAAKNQLRQAFATTNGLLTLIFDARGLANTAGTATRRQVSAQTTGPIPFTPRHGSLRTPTRNFEIPMVAPDPIAYDADNLRTQAVPMTNVNTGVTSLGAEQVGFTARFTGPFTNATLARVSDGATLVLTGSLTAGQYVDVSTFGMFTAVRDDASNQMGLLTAFKASRIRPGTENWKASAASGTTGASGVTLTWRDGW